MPDLTHNSKHLSAIRILNPRDADSKHPVSIKLGYAPRDIIQDDIQQDIRSRRHLTKTTEE